MDDPFTNMRYIPDDLFIFFWCWGHPKHETGISIKRESEIQSFTVRKNCAFFFFLCLLATLGAKGIFFSKSERTLRDSKSTVKDETKTLWSYNPKTSFPCHQIGTEFVLDRWLDITFEGVSVWTNRKTSSQQLLRQAALCDFSPRGKGQTVQMVHVLL